MRHDPRCKDAEKRVQQGKRRPRAAPRLKNGGISLSRRFLEMNASTANSIRQKPESIPELLKLDRTIMKFRLRGKSGPRVSDAASPGVLVLRR